MQLYHLILTTQGRCPCLVITSTPTLRDLSTVDEGLADFFPVLSLDELSKSLTQTIVNVSSILMVLEWFSLESQDMKYSLTSWYFFPPIALPFSSLSLSSTQHSGQRLTVVRRNRANQPRSSRSPMVSRSRSASSSQQNYPPTLRRLPQREEDRLFPGQGHSQSNSNATQPTSSRVDDSGDAPSAPFDPEAAFDTDAVSTSSIDGIAVSAAASQPRPAALYVPSPRRGPSISDWDSEAGEMLPFY